MFTNLIESDSHRKEFKRRSSFFLATISAYALILSAAGVASIYAYDAHLEAQTTDLTLLSWVPQVKPIAPATQPQVNQTIRRLPQSNAPVDPHITTPERVDRVATVDDLRSTPKDIGVTASTAPPVVGPVNITNRNANPPGLPDGNQTGCLACNTSGSDTVVRVPDPPPVLAPVKPQTQRLPSTVLVSKAISLPQPPYPPLARQIKVSGAVSVQILVDESGRVVAAHAVSGHPFLTKSAEEAAQRARFTPTVLNGQTVKVQGVITYNFVLQ
jgi:protein TonB